MKAQESEFRDSAETVKSLQTERSFMNAQPRNLEPAMTTCTSLTTDDAKWEAVVRRDPAADNTFYYSVKTTGVYCRPSCPTGRQALRQNVAFHPTAEAAEAAGFRPCKRCSPKGKTLAEERAAKVAAACRSLEAEEPPALDELARGAGLSPYHFHRVFKAVTGLTPKAYAVAHRARRVREELAKRPTVTEAIYEAGFQSNSPFYAKSAQTLGMTPTGFRNGGAGATLRFAVAQGSLGAVLVAASEKGVCAISLGDDPDALVRDLQDRFPKARLIGGDAEFERRVAQVIGFIEAPRTGLDLPLDVQGTAFQQKVWQALQEIPAGSTASYADVARRIGAPKAVRAVAQACAANPLAVAIPCHRVVRHDGQLSGYRWGVERKSALLAREAGV
jgi:AraC family transcriptional regulator of adaptative response/methylated-DNA-[protein]-cysteine methyltransferase